MLDLESIKLIVLLFSKNQPKIEKPPVKYMGLIHLVLHDN
jgi:hypothetical protein